jgi:hypothetical protein
MATWSHFVTAVPHLAAQVHAFFAPFGQSLGYLATVRPDGGPRVHPVMPLFTEHGLFCFVVASPKRRDLERDRRYALHALPGECGDDEAYVTGTADPVTDRSRVEELAETFRAAPDRDWRLFELHIDVAMVGRAGLAYEIWRDDAGGVHGHAGWAGPGHRQYPPDQATGWSGRGPTSPGYGLRGAADHPGGHACVGAVGQVQ